MRVQLAAALAIGALGVASAVGYWAGQNDFRIDRPGLVSKAQAASEMAAKAEWSPTKPYPKHDVYYPGTEALAPDEMRVISCGSGMPMPRLKQAAPCFLIELGNSDKFIFDMGTGSMERLYSLGIPLDYIRQGLPHASAWGPYGRSAGILRLWSSEQPVEAPADLGSGRRGHPPGVEHEDCDGAYGEVLGLADRNPGRND